MSNEPYKWELNPTATLRELARSETDEGYGTTICGVHRQLWLLLNVDANGHIPEALVHQMNELLEKAYKMGKRMDYRLHQYYYKEHGTVAASSQFTEEVACPPAPKPAKHKGKHHGNK